jgi:crotonobetainyl-CoA:carnitine CoA-transferase CaiB-like acyl-CoA transferase
MGSPLRMDGDRADSDLPPPGLGQHTYEILRSLSLDPSEIARLKSEGITG